jgi:putative protease
LWILRDYDEENKLVRVEVKNRFNLWDEIEIISPSWIRKIKVEKIYKTTLNHWTHKANTTFTEYSYKFDKTKAEETNEAHGWGYEVWINMEEKPEEFSLIRKEI